MMPGYEVSVMPLKSHVEALTVVESITGNIAVAMPMLVLMKYKKGKEKLAYEKATGNWSSVTSILSQPTMLVSELDKEKM
jgi:hypothetical protein